MNTNFVTNLASDGIIFSELVWSGVNAGFGSGFFRSGILYSNRYFDETKSTAIFADQRDACAGNRVLADAHFGRARDRRV